MADEPLGLCEFTEEDCPCQDRPLGPEDMRDVPRYVRHLTGHRIDCPAVIVTFRYRNHQGEIADRRVIPYDLRRGSSDHHPERQWLMNAFDLVRNAPRSFAVRDILGWGPGCSLESVALRLVREGRITANQAASLLGIDRREVHRRAALDEDRPPFPASDAPMTPFAPMRSLVSWTEPTQATPVADILALVADARSCSVPMMDPSLPPLDPAKPERVLCIPRSEFERVGAFQGFVTGAERWLTPLLRPDRARFLLRTKDGPKALENDPSWKQVISYVVIRSGGLVWTYRRGPGGGEARLHRKLSIGVGGHVTDRDGWTHFGPDPRVALTRGMVRELEEEVRLISPVEEFRQVGLVYDPSTLVGRVHLGVVYLLDLWSPDLDAAALDGDPEGWLSPLQLETRQGELESWSAMIVSGLLRRTPRLPG